MSVITLPWSMEQDRENQIKANSVHVDDNFNTLLTGVNNKLDLDGTSTPTADIPMGGHKLTNLATPTVSADATTKGYVDTALTAKAALASPTFTGTPTAPTVNNVADNSTKIATTEFVVDVLKAMYPVGAVFIGTQNTCPMSAFFGTWDLVATDRALWGGDGTNGATTIAAGLPNITGTADVLGQGNKAHRGGNYSGALKSVGTASVYNNYDGTSANDAHGVALDASLASSIYDDNVTTVQPPAYVVNVWRRTA